MKRSLLILPFACSAPAFIGCSTPAHDTSSWMPRVEPLEYIRHATQNADDYYFLGRYYQGQNRLEKAEEAYKKALKIHANHVDAQNALGTVYSKQGKYDQAIAVFTGILNAKPEIAKVFNNLGYTYYLQNKPAEAIAAYEKAIQLEPNNPRAHNNLGAAYQLAGNETSAKVAFARAAEIHAGANLGDAPQKHDPAPTLAEAPRFVDLHPRISQSISLVPPTARVVTIDLTASPQSIALSAPPHQAAQHDYAYSVTKDGTTTPITEKAAVSTPSPTTMAQESHRVMTTMAASSQTNPSNTPTERPKESSTKSQTPTPPQKTPDTPQPDGNKLATIGQHRKIITTTNPYRLEVSNGNGITGMAKRTSLMLTDNGLPKARLTNFRPFQQSQTIIHYRAGFQEQAMAINLKFGGQLKMVEAKYLRANTDVKLLLGKDMSAQTLATYGQVMA